MTELEGYYFKDDNETFGGTKVPPITEEFVENNPSIVDRFFTRYYYTIPGKPGEDFQVLFHSNRVCLICLSPNHVAFSKGIKSISFDIGNTDRSKNKVKGKGKKGGMILQEDSALALITCSDGSAHKIPSCVPGKLLEVNERIVTNVDLLKVEGDGYVAIVLTKPEDNETIKKALISADDFKQKLEKEL